MPAEVQANQHDYLVNYQLDRLTVIIKTAEASLGVIRDQLATNANALRPDDLRAIIMGLLEGVERVARMTTLTELAEMNATAEPSEADATA